MQNTEKNTLFDRALTRIRAIEEYKTFGRALVRIRAIEEYNTLFGRALDIIRAKIMNKGKKKTPLWQGFG